MARGKSGEPDPTVQHPHSVPIRGPKESNAPAKPIW
jgi:hypothetical protein